MEVSKVYKAESINPLLEKIDFDRLGDNVGIKVHFGEKGCITYMDPKIVKVVYDKVISLGKKATLIETNVLYRGERTKASTHIKLAHEHGFDFAPIDILDGEMGDKFDEIQLEEGRANPVKIANHLKKYDSMIAISHFKGHMSAGYGAVFKNIGMGLGSRAGKLHMHVDINPSVNGSACTGCGACFRGCDFDAITYDKNDKAVIDQDKCTGCAMCIAVCPVGAVQVPWGNSSSSELQEKIVDYADGVLKIIPKEKCLFINILENITENCDCDGRPQKPVMEDVGILYSNDPVAIDKASLDLVKEESGNGFDKVNRVDKSVQTFYAAKKGLGNLKYDLCALE